MERYGEYNLGTISKTMTSDWKETLFIWKGLLNCVERDGGEKTLDWRGSWVGTEDATAAFPRDDEFDSSENKFELVTLSVDISRDECTIQGSFVGGFYLLDNGNGLEKFADNKHDFCFYRSSVNRKVYHVAAIGDTEFGSFVSKGVWEVNPDNPSSGVMTLARRYVSSRKDARLSVSVFEAAKMEEGTFASVYQQLALPEPWRNLPVKAEKQHRRGKIYPLTEQRAKKQKA